MAPARRESAPYLSGVILAAGSSTRMGRPKQLLPLAGRPMLEQVIGEAAASRLDELVLLLGYRAAEIGKALRMPPGRRVRVVVNQDHASGQSSSLRLGVRSVSPRTTAVAVLLGDEPGVTARLIDRVVELFLSSPRPAARPVYAGSGTQPVPGHPVLLARRLWPELDRLQGPAGAGCLLAEHRDWVVELPVEGEAPTDVDSQADYEQAAAAAQRTPQRLRR